MLNLFYLIFFFFKQKTAYEMRISDWSSDVCSSDLSGSVRYRDKEILGLPARELNKVRGVTLSMIFQDPMTSLNPYLRISKQMTEVLVEHKGFEEAAARQRSIALLDRVGIP